MSGSRARTYWLVTFGDLLTLLLCFFVAMVSLSQHSVTDSEAAVAGPELQPPEKTEQTIVPPLPASRGVEIALTIDNRDLKELLLQRSDFNDPLPVLSEAGLKKVQKAVEAITYTLDEVIIETCNADENVKPETAWHLSVVLGLGLRRQIVDAVNRPVSVAVRSVGPWCDTIDDLENGAISRIQFKGQPEEHGNR